MAIKDPLTNAELTALYELYRNGCSIKRSCELSGVHYRKVCTPANVKLRREFFKDSRRAAKAGGVLPSQERGPKPKKMRAGPGGRPEGDTILTKKLRAELINYRALDQTIEECARLTGISPGSIYNWRKNDPTFDAEMDNARGALANRALAGMVKAAGGHKVKELKLFASQGVVMDQREVDKYFPPDSRAAYAILTNLAGWVRDNQPKPPDMDTEEVEYDIRSGLIEEAVNGTQQKDD